MSRSALGDGEILQATVIRDDECFEYTFPGGDTLRSDPIPPDKRKAGVLTAWCDAVRARDAANRQAAQDEARAKRARKSATDADETPSASAPDAQPEQPGPTPSSNATDPEIWVQTSLEIAKRRFTKAEVEFDSAKADLEKWQRLAAALDLPNPKGD